MNTYWQRLAAASCFLFGLALIANTLTAADGLWYWYAWYLQQGKRLYADMHLAMQPLFVLEAEFFLALLGKGWIVSKIPAVLNLLGLCLGIFLLSRRSGWKDHQKAVLIACVFFVSLRSVFYRFDDYHIPADCLFLFSLLLLLLMLENDSSFRRNTCLAGGLGVLSGLTFVLRLNDGAALIGAVAAIILCVAPGRKLALVAVFSLAIALTIEIIVLLSGDTLHSYAVNSIFRAAGAKGGVASLLAYPFLTPGNVVRVFIEEPWIVGADFAILAAAFSWAFLLRPFSRENLRSTAAKAALGLLVIAIAFQRHVQTLIVGNVILALLPVWVLVAYGLSLAAVIRFFRSRFTRGQPVAWNSFEILLLVPLAMVASLSMTSAGQHYNLYPACAVVILLLPIASPIRLHEGWRRSTFLAVAVIMSLSGLVSKGLHPVSWLSYWSGPVFRHRQIFHHPAYGPMVIEKPLLQFIEPVCEQIRRGPPKPELLSMPYSFANYFCVIPPWHGYVQTFFDTSTEAVISRLMDELQSTPPLWILYQRQPTFLASHEEIFRGGQRLPHRDLDELIMRKIDQGEWLVADRREYLEADWMLLRTRK